MKYTPFSLLSLILCFGLVSFSGCEDDDPTIENEPELIGYVTYTLTPQGGGTPVVFTYTDLDGDGATPPVQVASGPLSTNTTYDAVIQLSGGVGTDDVTAEILAEAKDHQFFYVPSSDLDLTFDYSDEDGDGNPLGLRTTVVTGAASSGSFTITLRHEPNKDASIGIADLSAAGGETDVELSFSAQIQ